MLKKTLKVLFFLAVLGMSANANDLLANISKGAISDSSSGVKVLNPEQMSKIRGGYTFTYHSKLVDTLYSRQVYYVLELNTNEKLGKGICYFGKDCITSNLGLSEKRNLDNALSGLLSNELPAIAFTQTKTPQFFGYLYNYSYDPRAVNVQTGKVRAWTGNSWIRNATLDKSIKNHIFIDSENKFGRFY